MKTTGGPILAVLACSCLVLLVAPRATEARHSEGRLAIGEVALGQLEPQPFHKFVSEVVRVSPDSRHVAFAAEQGRHTVVFVDGVVSEPYDGVGAVAFSPKGDHVAYVASRTNKWFLVYDGRERLVHDDIGQDSAAWRGAWPFSWSPNGQRIAYVATDRRRQSVVVDGEQGDAYDEILPDAPVFSPDSQCIAYAARRGQKVVIVVDGKIVAEADRVAEGAIRKAVTGICFSPNSKRVAMTVQRGGSWFVIVDGVESRAWDGIEYEFGHGFPSGRGGVRFSSDSRHFAYEVKRDGKMWVVVDGQEQACGEYAGALLFSPNSQRTAYVRLDDTKAGLWTTTVVVDGVAGTPFDGSVEQMCFSPDSRQLVYAARRGHTVEYGAQSVVINGKAGREYDQVGEISWDPVMFNPGGGRLAYAASRSRGAKGFLKWLEGKTGRDFGSDRKLSCVVLGTREFRIPKELEGAKSSFSPNGKRWGYFLDRERVAGEAEREETAFVDGKRVGYYGPDNCAWSKRIVFSPDSRHFAFQAYRGSWRGLLVIDGIERDIAGEWLVDSELVFDSPTHMHGLIMREQRLNRLEIELLPEPSK